MVNAKEVAEYVAATNNISKAAAAEIVKDVFGYIREELANGAEVRIDKFGTFLAENKPARTGRNPKTGEPIEIGPKTVAKFRPASELKKSLNP